MTIDMNLLPALDALLAERSVTRAAARVGVTVPSMSRTLARLRASLGDQLLVRAGRGLVPTPHALALRERVAAVAAEARELLGGSGVASPAAIERTLVLRANDGVVGPWAEPLLRAVRAQAPRLTLAFVSEGEERPDDLREGRVDLDLGAAGGDDAPELRTQALLRDRVVGVVRRGHPLLRGRRSPERLTAFEHVSVSRRGRLRGPIDAALAAQGLERRVAVAVATASAAALAVATSTWVAAMPSFVARWLADVVPVVSFELPLALPPIILSQTWHPRSERDPAHRVLRACVAELARRQPKGAAVVADARPR